MVNDAEQQQLRISQLESELEEMTLAVTEAWDRLAALLQSEPPPSTRTESSLTHLETMMAATNTSIAGLYKVADHEWFTTPLSIPLPPKVMTELDTKATINTVFRATNVAAAGRFQIKWMFAPIIVGGRVAGAVGVGTEDFAREFVAADEQILARLAERLAGAFIANDLAASLQREAESARELRIAHLIQSSMLPSELPSQERFSVASQ
jgi:hypothetical protein